MHKSISLRFHALPTSETPAAACWLALALVCFFASGLQAGVAPNSDGSQSDNGVNDPYYVEAGHSFTYFRVFDDDTLIVNGGTISNQSRPQGFWRSAIRLLDQSHAIINGGVIQDVDTQGGTWTLHVEDQSQLTVNGGTLRENGGAASALLYATDNSFTTINNGDFRSEQNPPIFTWFSGSVTINGGAFASNHDNVVEHRSDGLVTISGGTFSGPAAGVVVDRGSLILSGGVFTTDLDLLTSGGNTELVARSANLGGVPLSNGQIVATAGMINLVWPNGTAESLQFQRQAGTIRLTLIPEPNSLLLLAISAISLLGYRKAKSHG